MYYSLLIARKFVKPNYWQLHRNISEKVLAGEYLSMLVCLMEWLEYLECIAYLI